MERGVKRGPFSRGTIGGGTRGSPALWHRRGRNRRFPVPLQLRVASRLPQTGRDPGIATSFASSPHQGRPLFFCSAYHRENTLPHRVSDYFPFKRVTGSGTRASSPRSFNGRREWPFHRRFAVENSFSLLFPAFGKLLITLLEVVIGPISMRRSLSSVKRFHRVAHLGEIKSAAG